MIEKRRYLGLLEGVALVALLVARTISAADWRVQSNIPFHVYGHAAATLQGKIHLLGGDHTSEWQKPSAMHQVYDPVADKWETKIDAPRVMKRVFFLTQCSSSAIDADGRLWVVGGMGEDHVRTVVTEYLDIKKGVFVRGPDIAFGRCCGGGGIANGGTLSIMGGFVDGPDLGNAALPTWTLDTTKLR